MLLSVVSAISAWGKISVKLYFSVTLVTPAPPVSKLASLKLCTQL